MDGGKLLYAKLEKSIRERKRPYDFTHVYNIRKKRGEHGAGGRKVNQETDSSIQNKL